MGLGTTKMGLGTTKLILLALAAVAVAVMVGFSAGTIITSVEAGTKSLGIDLLSGGTDYIKNFEAAYDNGQMTLTWAVPEGKGDLIERYELYKFQRPDLKEDQKELISERRFDYWMTSNNDVINNRKWVINIDDYGWYVVGLVAVTKTGEYAKEAALWVPHIADTACNLLSTEEADDCYSRYAAEYQDAVLCSRIASSDKRDWCYGGVSGQTGSEGICMKISDLERKNSCYKQAAIMTGNADICESITGTGVRDLKNSCYKGAAITANTPVICEKINVRSDRDSCYAGVAANAANKELCLSICGSISQGSVKTGCEEKC